MPVHTGKGSRSYGTVLMDKVSPVARGSSKAITRKFDVSHYELTGEIRYLDGVEGNRVKNINRADRMRIEVNSVEQIKRLGGIGGVANYYKVSYSTAQKHCQAVESKEKPQEIPAPVKPDSAPSEPEGVPESDCTCEPVSVGCEPNLNEVEKFFEEPQPDLSDLKPLPIAAAARHVNKAVLLIAEVERDAKAEVQRKIHAYFEQANNVLAELGQTENRVDQLINEIRVEFLGIVERELGMALEVGK